MPHRLRTIDLALPAVLAVAAVVAFLPGPGRESPDAVPVRGTIADPCTGENLVFAGTADVRTAVTPGGGGGYGIEIVADLTETTATGATGEPYDLSGTIVGLGDAVPPLPLTIEIVGTGLIVRAGSTQALDARARFTLTMEEDGAASPTGAIELLSLACQEEEES